MKVTLVPGRELSHDLVDVWAELQRSNPALASPYFRPEFARAIAAVRNDVEIAVVEEGNRLAAFLPFQRRDNAIGIPVGGIISDYQGLICAQQFVCDPRDLVRRCRLVVMDFDHLLASQLSFAPFHRYFGSSPQIDLSAGYEAYANKLHAAGSEQIKKCTNSMRRIEREVGPLRFVAHEAGHTLARKVLAWKSRQYIESGKPDLLTIPWIRAAVERIQTIQLDEFAGMLSLLYAGERLVAGHLGMRGQFVWHYWLPSYDPEMAKYSPGIILLLKMAEHASRVGIHTIDLGLGMSLYKQRLMSDSVTLAGGSVELPSWHSLRRNARRALRALWERLPLGGPVRDTINSLRRGHGWAQQGK